MVMMKSERNFIVFCFVGFVLEEAYCQSNLINFGGSTEESKQAEYYMMVDSQFPNTSPTEDLKRTQRSFWKKLFKNGLFGDGECNDSCNYSGGGDGNSFSPPIAESIPPFQPFRPLQTWRPFQPWFRGNCQRCGYAENNYNYANGQGSVPYNNNYGDNPSFRPNYGDRPINDKPYNSNEDNNGYNKQDQTSEALSITPTESGNAVDNNEPDPEYEPVSELSENMNTQPYENKDNTDLLNMKIPQILYQPIIYVSPQYQEQAPNQLQLKTEYSGKTNTINTTNVENQMLQTDYAADPSQTQQGCNYSSASEMGINDASKYPKSALGHTNPQLPHYCGQPCPANIQMPTPFIGRANPSVSTVSTVYTVITPPQVAPATTLGDTGRDNCNPSTPVTSTNQYSTGYQPTGPSKYSLFPTKGISTPGYAKNIAPPMHMTLDDQPYRVCPELFEDYNRQLNKIIPCAHASSSSCNSGNTFINAQVISY